MAKNKDTEIIDDAADAGAEPRIYELGFHLDPELPTEEVKKAYHAIHESIASKGPIVAEVEPENVQLAYTISRHEVAGRRDFSTAYFAWIVYEATATDHADIIAAATANTSIIRFIDIVTTKEAARHALEVHELAAKAPEPAEQNADQNPDDTLNTEIDAALAGAAL